MKHSGMHFLG